MKYSMYRNFAVMASALGLVGLIAGCLEMSISFDSTSPNLSSKLPEKTPKLQQSTTTTLNSKQTASAGVASVTNTPNKQLEKPTPKNSPHQSKGLGSLRMRNQTNQPVRLALLARHSAVKNASASKTKNNLPAHWDFDPQEGSQKGLILSLPEGNLNLEKGDILVAFAQDGSRRYWGPYVVGETSAPQWNSQVKEWQLILTP
ncbi:hypothetical protein A0J48_004055 [Sphaerospermopsis aphanizomenoides BCCUSP55]|uniref:hypothetical protein n=1 Tax=Sphaerospermopsis aphanizomenoides TaxID=459663 RepID=UPI0019054C1E|nr:hypothetical protein [Sphaerospermopsis aphanizomenoides]MBK1986721.1 hypothetical protein [Sphaerospermopsis aphanizomenoides BCCUSP55]